MQHMEVKEPRFRIGSHKVDVVLVSESVGTVWIAIAGTR